MTSIATQVSCRLAAAAALCLALTAQNIGAIAPLTSRVALAAGTNGNTCGSKSQYQDGWSGTLDTWGASAWINARYPNFCFLSTDPMGTNDHTFAWSMIAKAGYTQTGYLMYTNWSSPEIWAEYSDYNPSDGCAGDYCDTYSGVYLSVGANHQYWEDYDTYSVKTEDMGYDNTFLVSTPYDPANGNDPYNWWSSHWRSYYKGEAHFLENDVPGSPTSKASFTSVAYESSVNSTGAIPPSFNNLSGHSASSDNLYHWCVQNTSGSYSSFNIWTDWNNNGPTPS